VVLTVAASNGTVTISDIYIGESKLTKTTDYTENEGVITIKKEKIDDLEAGVHTVIVETDQGDVTAVVTVEDTTALSADPATATFDKNTSGEGYDDVVIEVKHNTSGVTLTSVHNGEVTLTPTTHYTADGLVVTLLKTYLATLDEGEATITFKTNKGDVSATVNVVDTTDEV
jgi:pyoverdine/dityrosine biosynthesis protein Dit1